MAVVAISEINPITFWMPTPFPLGAGIDLAATKATFNTEDKDDVIQFQDKYFHELVTEDTIPTEIVIDDDHLYKLYVFNDDGSPIGSFDFVQVGATTHQRYTISPANLAVIRALDTGTYGKYVFFAIVDDDDDGGPLVYGVSDSHIVMDSTTKSVVIGYQSIREYTDILPDVLMFVRLPAAFFQPETTEEVATSSTSAGSITSLTGEVSTSCRLKTNKLPYYWDRKIKLILKSHILQIRGATYKQTVPATWRYIKDNYEFGTLNALLYLQNSTKRNVYATPAPE